MSQNVRYLEKSDIKLASLIIFGALGFTLFAVSKKIDLLKEEKR